MKLQKKIQKIKIFILFFAFCSLVCGLCGCEAFVKKFTRKPKHEKPAEEMILIPEQYPSLFKNKEEAYRQYFLYWKSWQDELINALLAGKSQKKQLSCIDEAIKNLMQVKSLLLEEKQRQLDAYITKFNDLRDRIEIDSYSNNANRNRATAETLKRNVLRDFSYSKIKNFLK